MMKKIANRMREFTISSQTVMQSMLLCCLFLFSATVAFAQDFELRKGDCMPHFEDTDNGETPAMKRAGRRLPALQKQWDASKTYHQLVILVEYKQDSVKFLREDACDTYDKILNQKGYNERAGKGCMADYFREQSGGLANFQFDVYGPYTVDYKAQPYDDPTESTRNYGKDPMRAATNLFLEENPTLDFSQYDWNNDGTIEQVIYVHAGFSGNSGSKYGYIWPNTSSFSTITTPDGKKIYNYTASAELWPNKASCGFGTICHEFTHSLGLPDFYPTNSSAGYSVLDEWDLMDGGNFTNYGWCPPNYTPMEKYLLGWVSFEELTDPITIKNMKPSSAGGPIYKITHSDKEYLLLENRQQADWDLGAPGKGLCIYHVYYDKSTWSANTVNNNASKRRYNLMNADNMDYDAWDTYLQNKGVKSPYQNPYFMNRWYLSTSPYPYITDETTNNQLTDTSTPAARMNEANDKAETLLGKPITNIQQNEDGTVSFDFMGGDTTTAIRQMPAVSIPAVVYDLSGRSYQSAGKHGIYLLRKADGTIRKVLR